MIWIINFSHILEKSIVRRQNKLEEKKDKINKTKISVVLGIMCFALALGICIQIRTVKTQIQQLAVIMKKII